MAQAWTAGRANILEAGRWLALAAMAALPIAKPAVNIFLFFALLAALAGSDMRARFAAALRQPVVLGCMAWFGVLALSAAHAGDARAWSELAALKALFYPLLLGALLTTPAWRRRGLAAFAFATAIVLLLSWAQLFGLPAPHDLTAAFEAYRYTVFHEYSQQGIQFLILAAMCMAWAPQEANTRLRLALYAVAALALANVVFLLQSRTSYLSVVPLLLYWAWRLAAPRLGHLRSVALGVLLLALLAGAAALTPRVQERMEMASNDISHYMQKREATSLGIRLELWQRTLQIIGAAPLFGHGLGGWLPQFQAQTAALPDFDSFRMGHPHQEWLLLAAEEGLAGALLFAALLVLLARRILHTPQPGRDVFASILLLYLSAGLANCLMSDFVQRHVLLMLLGCFPLATPKEST